jgi:predicted metal-dependent hydrolase
MKKRWGSCTPNGKVILNVDLIRAPKGCIEYVIIHELCHLIHHSHNKSFYELQDSIMPDWKRWKDRLEHSLV